MLIGPFHSDTGVGVRGQRARNPRCPDWRNMKPISTTIRSQRTCRPDRLTAPYSG